MNLNRLVPWNWFKQEEEEKMIPVSRQKDNRSLTTGTDLFHKQLDKLLNSFFRDFESGHPSIFNSPVAGSFLEPKVNIHGDENQYTASFELPGLEEKDINIELKNDHLVIRAEKKHESEVKKDNYYCIERSSGTYRRILNLPEDADGENIDAKLKNGVLTIDIPRNKLPEKETKRIEVKSS